MSPRKPRARRARRAFLDAITSETGHQALFKHIADGLGLAKAENLARAPCVVCGNLDAIHVGIFKLSPELARKCGKPDGIAATGYRLCASCEAKTGKEREWMFSFIEAAIVARRLGQSFVPIGSDGMPKLPWEEC